VQAALGLPVTTLRCLDWRTGAGGEDVGVFLVEGLTPTSDPAWHALPGALWLAPAADGPSLGPAAGPAHRVPWARAGWHATATAWIHQTLAGLGITPRGPVEQVRTWWLSCLLRLPTSVGVVWLKAAPPIYRFEPRLTQALAAAYPGLVPPVLAIEPERGWLLMRHVDGDRLDRDPDRERYLRLWEDLLRRVARVQLDAIGRGGPSGVGRLLSWGCPDRRPERLAAALDPFLDELPDLLAVAAGGAAPPGARPEAAPEVQRLRACAPRLREAAADLAALGIPASLCHGDLHSGNILRGAGGAVLLDWAGFVDVAHPFGTLSAVFEEHPPGPARDRLVDAYLESFTGFAARPRLRAAVGQAHLLALLDAALGHATQLRASETPWEVAGERANLRWCLSALTTRATPGST
jgi:hypothetical protein